MRFQDSETLQMPFPLLGIPPPSSQLSYHQPRNFLFPFPKSQPSHLQEPSPHNFILGVTSLLHHEQVSTVTLTLHGNLLVTCLPPTTGL